MALSIKTEKADRLARVLARMTGETMTQVVTRSMEERLERLRGERRARAGNASRIARAAARIRADYDLEGIDKPDFDAEWGEPV